MIPPLVSFLGGAFELEPDDRKPLKAIRDLLVSTPRGDPAVVFEATPSTSTLHVRLSVLVPTRPDQALLWEVLTKLAPEDLVPNIDSPGDSISLLAGMFLVHDFLDEAHELAQQAERRGAKTTGPYWHGIMHRREPDYDNARYWFRRIGGHSIFSELGRQAGELLSDKEFANRLRFRRVLDPCGHWDPMAFIDLCESCGTAWNEQAQAAARLQEIEMRLLLEFTCRAACGEN